jgi:hypothetical protein
LHHYIKIIVGVVNQTSDNEATKNTGNGRGRSTTSQRSIKITNTNNDIK